MSVVTTEVDNGATFSEKFLKRFSFNTELGIDQRVGFPCKCVGEDASLRDAAEVFGDEL
jgi:hypothetical protein